MAVGSIIAGGITAAATGFGGAWDSSRAAVDISEAPSLAVGIAAGALGNTQPISEAPVAVSGSLLSSFFDDYYNRIHYSALSFALGSTAPGQQATLTLWNAYLTAKQITAVTSSGTGGIDAAGPGVIPYTMQPMEEATYTFTVRADGPPVIDTAFNFTIGGITTPVEFTGLLVTPWFYRPAGGVLERLEWLTDVIPTFVGGEQRRALRIAPRRLFEFDAILTAGDRRTAENALHDWQSRSWAVPVWMDAQPLPAAVAPGATTIAVDTTTRDFRAGGILGLATSARNFEILQIDTLTDSQVNLVAPVSGSWPAGTAIIFPIIAARMHDALTLSRFDGDTSYGRMRFEAVEPSDWPAATESTYRGLPVLGTPPNWTEDIEQQFLRLLQRIDAGTGPVVTDDQGAGPIILQSHRWLMDGRAQIDAFRRWLYARRGRLSAFWLPTFAQDFTLVATIGSTATTIDVEHCGYTLTIAQAINRRDIRIELHSGTVYMRRITGSAEVSGQVERLTIDAVLGVSVAPDQVRAISYMAVVRLDSDAAEISWDRHDLAESRLMTRGSRNDL
jgi:hypothetical protein